MAQMSAATLTESRVARGRSDGDHIPKLVQLGSDPKSIMELPLFDRTVGYCAWALMNSLGERILSPE